MNGEQLVLLLVENGIWVSRRGHDLFEPEELSGTDEGTQTVVPNGQVQDMAGAKGPKQ
jgi:hypothetical protein